MKEEKTPLQPFLVKLRCSRCEQGMMELVGIGAVIEEDGVQYRHECTACDLRAVYRRAYPYITWEELETTLGN